MRIYSKKHDTYLNIHMYQIPFTIMEIKPWKDILPRRLADTETEIEFGIIEYRWLIWNILIYLE